MMMDRVKFAEEHSTGYNMTIVSKDVEVSVAR